MADNDYVPDLYGDSAEAEHNWNAENPSNRIADTLPLDHDVGQAVTSTIEHTASHVQAPFTNSTAVSDQSPPNHSEMERNTQSHIEAQDIGAPIDGTATTVQTPPLILPDLKLRSQAPAAVSRTRRERSAVALRLSRHNTQGRAINDQFLRPLRHTRRHSNRADNRVSEPTIATEILETATDSDTEAQFADSSRADAEANSNLDIREEYEESDAIVPLPNERDPMLVSGTQAIDTPSVETTGSARRSSVSRSVAVVSRLAQARERLNVLLHRAEGRIVYAPDTAGLQEQLRTAYELLTAAEAEIGSAIAAFADQESSMEHQTTQMEQQKEWMMTVEKLLEQSKQRSNDLEKELDLADDRLRDGMNAQNERIMELEQQIKTLSNAAEEDRKDCHREKEQLRWACEHQEDVNALYASDKEMLQAELDKAHAVAKDMKRKLDKIALKLVAAETTSAARKTKVSRLADQVATLGAQAMATAAPPALPTAPLTFSALTMSSTTPRSPPSTSVAYASASTQTDTPRLMHARPEVSIPSRSRDEELASLQKKLKASERRIHELQRWAGVHRLSTAQPQRALRSYDTVSPSVIQWKEARKQARENARAKIHDEIKGMRLRAKLRAGVWEDYGIPMKEDKAVDYSLLH